MDVVRKHQQIDYNETGCMVEKFPEAMHTDNMKVDNSEEESSLQSILATNTFETDNTLQAVLPNENNNTLLAVLPNEDDNRLHVIAPGEGKDPIAFCKDWDAKAFPMLHPDGKNHLFDERI